MVKGSVFLGALVLLAGGMLVAHQASSSAPASTVEVRWLLSHRPTGVFENAAKTFADVLNKESNGHLKLVVLQPEDVGFTGAGDIPYREEMALLAQGKADITNTYSVASAVEDPAFGVVSAPYMFRDYTSASKVFDGPIGTTLLEGLSKKTGVVGLAFTYSGGYRILISDTKAVRTPEDLKGLRIATSGGVLAEAYWRSLGAVPVSLSLEEGNASLEGVDAIETTYSRLSEVVGTHTAFTKYISETNHSLFTTILVAENSFFNSLSPQDKEALTKAAIAAAGVERKDSIALGEDTRARLKAQGSVIETPSAALQTQLKEKAEALYRAMSSTIDPSIVSAIQAAQ